MSSTSTSHDLQFLKNQYPIPETCLFASRTPVRSDSSLSTLKLGSTNTFTQTPLWSKVIEPRNLCTLRSVGGGRASETWGAYRAHSPGSVSLEPLVSMSHAMQCKVSQGSCVI